MTRKATDAAGAAGRRYDTVALLAAFSLFLSSIEFIIPKPLPFLRLGLANLAFLVGLRVLGGRELMLLMAAKVAAQGLLFGTLLSYTFVLSAFGSLAAGLVMLAVDRWGGKHISLIGVSVSGACASNAAQIAVAGLIFLGPGVWLITPPFLVAGLVTSIILGVMAERFTAQSRWVKKHRLNRAPVDKPGKPCDKARSSLQ
jgi:heptaprenyl diphosphate synthase